MNEGFPTEFRKRYAKKLIVGGSSTAALGLIIWQVILPAIAELRQRTEVLQAITEQLRNLERRADQDDESRSKIWQHITMLEKSVNYQQGFYDGLKSRPAAEQ